MSRIGRKIRLGVLLIAVAVALPIAFVGLRCRGAERHARQVLVEHQSLLDSRGQKFPDVDALYGHRGHNTFAPENTLLSYKTARERGFRRVEMDITFTADDEIILFHDSDLMRFRGDSRTRCEIPFQEFEQLQPARIFFSEVFAIQPEMIDFLQQTQDPWLQKIFRARVPRLEEVFQELGTAVQYHLDLKNLGCRLPTADAAKKLTDLIRRFSLLKNVSIESTVPEFLHALHQEEPALSLMLWDNAAFRAPGATRDALKTLGVGALDFDSAEFNPSQLQEFEHVELHTFTVNRWQSLLDLHRFIPYIITDLDACADKPMDRYQYFNSRSQIVKMHYIGDAPPLNAATQTRVKSGNTFVDIDSGVSESSAPPANESPWCAGIARCLGQIVHTVLRGAEPPLS